MESECWKPFPAAPNYEVSNLGRVRRIVGGQGARPMIRKTDLERTGYLRVRLSHAGVMTRVSVHRAVATAFLGDPPSEAHQAAHFDGDKTNNAASNLRWATCHENILDKQRHSTQARGETQGRSKLTNEDVKAIRAVPDYRGIATDLGRIYGISGTQVARIRSRSNWTHI